MSFLSSTPARFKQNQENQLINGGSAQVPENHRVTEIQCQTRAMKRGGLGDSSPSIHVEDRPLPGSRDQTKSSQRAVAKKRPPKAQHNFAENHE